MSLITPDFGLLFWMTIVFLLVLFILWKYGFPVITNMVKERKKFIDDSLRKAHEANEKLQNIQAESEQILQEARERQAQILKDAAATRDSIVSQAQDKAREESTRIIAEARTQIEAEKQNAIRDIRSQVATLSVQIAEKILRGNLKDDAQQMQYVDKLLDEVSSNNK